jgi:hypothetical protein
MPNSPKLPLFTELPRRSLLGKLASGIKGFREARHSSSFARNKQRSTIRILPLV